MPRWTGFRRSFPGALWALRQVRHLYALMLPAARAALMSVATAGVSFETGGYVIGIRDPFVGFSAMDTFT